jgi:hypothetical protein
VVVKLQIYGPDLSAVSVPGHDLRAVVVTDTLDGNAPVGELFRVRTGGSPELLRHPEISVGIMMRSA